MSVGTQNERELLTGQPEPETTGSQDTGPVGKAPAPSGIASRISERTVVFFLWLVMMALGVFFALLQPVWSRVDEAQHFHYVQYMVENGTLPVEGKTLISQRVVDVSLKSNQWGWNQAGTISPPSQLNPSQWITIPDGIGDQDREKWVRRNLWYFNYEAMQPPLYYAINVPVYAAVPGDSFIKLYAMRLFAVLIASTIVPVTWLFAREVSPENRLVTIGAPVVAILTQGYALNMSQISNDILAVPLAAFAGYLLLRMVSRGFSWKLSVVAGLVIGASLLSKLTTIFLLPVALVALAIPVLFRRAMWRSAIGHACLVYGAAATLMLPWMLRNVSIYGDATGASAARPLMSSYFQSPTISLGTLRLSELLPTFWFGEPVYPFALWTAAWVGVFTAMAVAVVGLLFYFTHGEEASGRRRMLVTFVVVSFATGLAVNLLIPFGSGIGGVPGRYLYPLIPAAAFLIMFGIDRLLAGRRARFLAEVLLVWMIVWESLNMVAYLRNP